MRSGLFLWFKTLASLRKLLVCLSAIHDGQCRCDKQMRAAF